MNPNQTETNQTNAHLSDNQDVSLRVHVPVSTLGKRKEGCGEMILALKFSGNQNGAIFVQHFEFFPFHSLSRQCRLDITMKMKMKASLKMSAFSFRIQYMSIYKKIHI